MFQDRRADRSRPSRNREDQPAGSHHGTRHDGPARRADLRQSNVRARAYHAPRGVTQTPRRGTREQGYSRVFANARRAVPTGTFRPEGEEKAGVMEYWSDLPPNIPALQYSNLKSQE